MPWSKDPEAAEQFYLDEEDLPVRYAVAYDPGLAKRSRERRAERIRKADRFIEAVEDRLRGASESLRPRGRPVTVQGAFEQIHDYLRDRNLERYYQEEITSKGLKVTENPKARKLEESIDGKLVVESAFADISAEELIGRHKELADIERAFRTFTSTLEMRPCTTGRRSGSGPHVFIGSPRAIFPWSGPSNGYKA